MIFNPAYPDDTKKIYATEHQLLKYAMRNPTAGTYSDTSSKVGPKLTAAFRDTIVDIVTGRQKMDAYDAALKRWKSGGGDKHVTLLSLRTVIVLLLILRIGDILSVGFEQFILQRDSVGPGAAEVLDTFTYYAGVVGGDWSSGAAAGLAKGVVGALLLWGANSLARRLGEPGIFQRRGA